MSEKTRKPMRPRILEEHREGLRVVAFAAETNPAAIVNAALALYLRIDAMVGLDRVRQAAKGDGLAVPDFVSGALRAQLADADHMAAKLRGAAGR